MDFARRQSGLTEAEATLLLAQVGPNVIRTDKFAGSFTSSPKRCASRRSNAEIANVLTMAALSSAVYPVDPMDVAIRRARQPLSPPFWGT